MHAYHGVLPQERTVGNDYLINIKVGYPWIRATQTDDVTDTLSYATLAELVKREMLVPSNLVEHVAGRIVEAVKAEFPAATYVRLRLTKIAPPMSADCDGAGVEIELDIRK